MKRKRDYKAEYANGGKRRYLVYKAEKRTWYYLNKKEALQRSNEWASRHPIKRNKIANAWYQRNKETINAKARKKYWLNIEETNNTYGKGN